MTILFSATGFDPGRWLDILRRVAPERSVITERSGSDDAAVDYAIVWKQPPRALLGLPGLKAIFSLGAGVDHLLRDPDLPDVPIVRVVAEDLTQRMTEFVVWRVLDHLRQGRVYREQQGKRLWHERSQPAAGAVTVGILGLGELGRDAADKLGALGFRLAGWTRSPRTVGGVETFHGAEGLTRFLALSDIVVVLLPLTAETAGIVDAAFLSKMKSVTPLGGPVLINAGRGGLQVEADILAALDAGTLMEASLDVFATEPLPQDSPLWAHPRVFVTPHAAAVSDPEALLPLMVAQMDAHDRGEPLRNLVDRSAGY
ncbi:glyoxylate/hydroxypyruvate reductase A [Aurantimonas sp. MSK8Z-1]|uniref:2-hydroxyacid dehydrogenase n=1 Tax=Mangrovibrevibacter kandeliae TaxID=2968473 RepID=UPI0021185DC1|nr:glyoxylate/hydroxypyruvate reductase A [Aurantimonas sp. MSK8Z-1]MCW4115980.1 glyoxylate/hydroxypyruvate reductase A [Aurantimonas sp. MSK8Z-1]